MTAAAVVLAAAVSGATLAPILHTSLDRWVPYLPVPVLATGIALVTAVVAAGLVAPVAVVARTPPTGEAVSP